MTGYGPFSIKLENYFNRDELENVGVNNIAAKLIAGEKFNDDLYSNGESVWENLLYNVECGESCKYEKILYWTVKYVDSIRLIHNAYIEFLN